MLVQRIQIKRRIAEIERLPISRSALCRIAGVLARGDATGSAKIAEAVFTDACLASVLIKTCYANVASAAPISIPTPQDVVTRLGSLQTRRIVAAQALASYLDKSGKSSEPSADSSSNVEERLDTLRRQAILTAVCARLLVQHAVPLKGKSSVLAGKAYLAGLVHDIGKFVLLATGEEDFVAETSARSGEERFWTALEERSVPHTLAGKWYGEQNGFPQALIDIIAKHHLINPEPDPENETDLLLTVLDWARRLSQAIIRDEDPLRSKSTLPLVEVLGIGEQDFVDLVDTCRAATQSVLQSMSFSEDAPDTVLQTALEILETDIRLAPGHDLALQRAGRFRAILRLCQTPKNDRSLDEIHQHIVSFIRDVLHITPCICSILDENAERLLLRLWDRLEEPPRSMTVPLEYRPSNPQQAALFNALHALGFGMVDENGKDAALRDVMNWGGIVAVPMLLRGACYGQIVFDAGSCGFALTEDQFDDLLAFGATCALLVAQYQEKERIQTEAETQLDAAARETELRAKLQQAERLATVGERSIHAIQSLNTPLSLATAQLQWFLNRCEDDKTRHSLEAVLRHTRAAYRTAKDLLLVAKPPQPRTEPTLVNSLLHQTVVQLTEMVSSRSIQIIEDYADGLPRIYADRRLLEHAVMNVLLRCLEIVGGKEGTLTVQTWAAPDRRAVLARISGVQQGEHREKGHQEPHVEPWTVDSESVTPSALSLRAAREILEAHGGLIEMESLPGNGCAFTIRFPAATAKAPHIKTAPPQPESGKTTCLIVDDDRNVREILREALETRNISATCAADGTEALEILERQSFHLIITDIRMPRMDGISLIRTLRARNNTTPVIVITGSNDPEDAHEALQTGACACIFKPFQLKQLFEAVTTALGSSVSQAL
ncbi:MAG TPA: response regulator [Candidatus Hydrogenedentes bacterium]|nr:response regulator [Candidatus Hydrogenedentota bacterium]HOL77637.1 response regulator [Candidatus Hydrogenedentota bacterium]HPO87381.1 response regulator [Candidatus Hydrogenedentota bacterium]